MSYPYPSGEDMLEGLDVTDAERLAFLRALDETEAEEAGILYEAEAGPWAGEAEQLEEIGAQFDSSYADAAATAAGDAADAEWFRTRPSAEDKLARAVGRVEDRSYTPPAYFRAARDTRGRFGHFCGPADPLGTGCGARFHQSGCDAVAAQAAATGSHEEARAWADVVQGHTSPGGLDASSIGLAGPGDPQPGSGADSWEDLLETGEPMAYPQIHAAMLAELGGRDAPARPDREPGVDTAWLARELGLR